MTICPGISFLKRVIKKIAPLLILAIIVVLLFKTSFDRLLISPSGDFEPRWGVTFSKVYAEELKLNWREAYIAMLDDLQISHLRLPIYWSDVAPTAKIIDYESYDWLLAEAAKRNVEVVVVIGKRVPRWPECYEPKWVQALPPAERQQKLLDMITATIKRYQHYENITTWQVENEPLVNWFGECERGDRDLLLIELELVRALDSRPILVTDSGELGNWKKTYAQGGDWLGITAYRITWNRWFGYFHYPLLPSLYHIKARLFGIDWQKVLIAELQAEPWLPNRYENVLSAPWSEQIKSMNEQQFLANLDLARALEVKLAYLWGVEWWYYLKIQGDERMWNLTKNLWQE